MRWLFGGVVIESSCKWPRDRFCLDQVKLGARMSATSRALFGSTGIDSWDISKMHDPVTSLIDFLRLDDNRRWRDP